MITFAELKEQIRASIGVCSEVKLRESAIDVLRFFQNEGSFGGLKKVKVYAKDSYITLPADIETPKKVLVNKNPRPVRNFWQEFNDVHSYDVAELNDYDCLYDFESGGIRLEPGTFATMYDIPESGGYVYFSPIIIPGVPLYQEKSELEGVIHGVEHSTKRDVVMAHKSQLLRGEVLNISSSTPLFSNVKYGQITNIIKPQTLNRIGLFWSESLEEDSPSGLLAEFSPFETRGVFKRVYVPEVRRIYDRAFNNLSSYSDCGVCLTILGTVRVKNHYDDNELIPFDLSHNFKVVAKALHNMANAGNSDEFNVGRAQKNEVIKDLNKEHGRKTSSGNPLNVINFRRRKLGGIH